MESSLRLSNSNHMENSITCTSTTLKPTTYLFLLAITITFTCATSSRILVDDHPPAIAPDLPNPFATPVTDVVSPISAPVATQPKDVGPTNGPLLFFVHDILGGSTPSANVVTGIHANSKVNGQPPFSNPSGVVNPVNCSDNENYVTFLTGIDGGDKLSGLQKLPFGTMTVMDDEMTEGQDIGSSVIGRAQGFYVVSSKDGSCMTMAFTAMFGTDNYPDSLSFFGVHQTVASESHVAVIGGTGRYVNVKGYAVVQTVDTTADQQMTDGLETILQFNVYFA